MKPPQTLAANTRTRSRYRPNTPWRFGPENKSVVADRPASRRGRSVAFADNHLFIGRLALGYEALLLAPVFSFGG